MNRIKALLGTVALTGGLGIVAAAPATATVDTTPPSLTLGATHYRTGAPIDDPYQDENGGYCTTPSSTCTPFFWSIPIYLTWKTGDPSGICSEAMATNSYEAYTGNGDRPYNFVTGTASYDGFDPSYFGDQTSDHVLMPNQTRRWNYEFTYDDRGANVRQLRVIDCANNMTVSPVFAQPRVDGLTEDSADTSQVIYGGAWATSKCLCFSGGTTHYSTVAGATASFSMSGSRVALVMEMAANRGSADVYVDGIKKATINTYSATTKHKMVVWESLVSTGMFHTIKVVNDATAGHARIDVDGLLHS